MDVLIPRPPNSIVRDGLPPPDLPVPLFQKTGGLLESMVESFIPLPSGNLPFSDGAATSSVVSPLEGSYPSLITPMTFARSAAAAGSSTDPPRMLILMLEGPTSGVEEDGLAPVVGPGILWSLEDDARGSSTRKGVPESELGKVVATLVLMRLLELLGSVPGAGARSDQGTGSPCSRPVRMRGNSNL